jgi:hypothetical protein
MSPVLQPERSSGTTAPARSTGVACLLVLVLVLAACSGGKKHSATTTTKPKAKAPRVLAIKTSVLRVGKVVVESAGAPNLHMDVPTGKAVLGVAQKYIDNAIFEPLKAGRLGDYASLFDQGVKSAALGADRRALTDLEAGKVARLTSTASPVELSALVGTLGEYIYVATDFDLTVKGIASTGPLTISHKIELTFAQTGKTWLVTAYRVQSVRQSSAGKTTTTTKGGKKP